MMGVWGGVGGEGQRRIGEGINKGESRTRSNLSVNFYTIKHEVVLQQTVLIPSL